MSVRNRLIWFQHFHKAAGTTVVELAREAGEILYQPNYNGNPVGDNGPLPIWEYHDHELLEFVDKCRHNGVTFVATEWGLPDIAALSSRPDVVLVTVLRNPYGRFISNYLFDYKHGFTNHRDVRDYVDSKGPFSSFNYYCRILAGKHGQNAILGHNDLVLAKEKLELFQKVALTDE